MIEWFEQKTQLYAFFLLTNDTIGINLIQFVGSTFEYAYYGCYIWLHDLCLFFRELNSTQEEGKYTNVAIITHPTA